MKIIHLIGDIYQVVDEEKGNTYFQGSIEECKLYMVKDNPFLDEFLKLFKIN